jgi:O-antigen/teichoic acid export membrane protein
MKKAFIWNGISLGTEFLIGFLSLSLVSRLFDESVTGVWVIFLTILFVITKMREGMIQNTLIKFSSQINSLMASTARFRILQLLIILELFVATGGFFASLFISNPALKTTIQLIGLVSFPQALYRFGLTLLQADLKNREMAMFNMIVFSGMLIGLSIIYLFKLELTSMLFLYSSIYFVSAMLLSGFLLKKLSWEFSDTSLPFKLFFQYVKHGFFRELIGTLSSRAYIFTSAYLGGFSTSASVGIASRYANLIYLPNSAYHGVLYPKACQRFSIKDSEEILRFFSSALRKEFLVFLIYAPLLAISSNWFIPVIHGQNYLDAWLFLSVLVFHGAFIAPVGHAFGSIMHLMEKPEAVTQLISIMSVLSLSTTVGFGLIWGVWGSLSGPIFTDIVGLFIMDYLLKRNGLSSLINSYRFTFSSIKKTSFSTSL